jgi:hypothetical protein
VNEHRERKKERKKDGFLLLLQLEEEEEEQQEHDDDDGVNAAAATAVTGLFICSKADWGTISTTIISFMSSMVGAIHSHRHAGTACCSWSS